MREARSHQRLVSWATGTHPPDVGEAIEVDPHPDIDTHTDVDPDPGGDPEPDDS